MRMCDKAIAGALAALVILVPVTVGGADNPPPYASATEAYRQGASAINAGQAAAAIPALEYAAERGVLGAQLKLARLYAAGRDVPEDDAKAFSYYQDIANQYADISPSSPVAKFIGEAFLALGQYYVEGIPAMLLQPDPAHAASLFRHAASYFGNAEAQYRLGRLYLDGQGVESNIGLAVNWLATAAKKQHFAAQATLGELLWRGEKVSQRRARGLALITLADANAKASGREPQWIGDLYREAIANSDKATRTEAKALVLELGDRQQATSGAAAKAKPGEPLAMPPPHDAGGGAKPAAAPAEATSLSQSAAPPPAPIGLSVGFGPSGSEPAGPKP